jgi:hypothetical protein
VRDVMREKEEAMFRDIDLQVAEETMKDRNRRAAQFRLEHQARMRSSEPTGRGLRIAPGKEKEFRCLQSWLAASDRLDRLIEATERAGEPEHALAPAPVAIAAAQRDAASPEGRLSRRLAAGVPAGRRPLVGALARCAGHALRRMGEGLEAWGSAPPAEAADVP